MPKETREVQLKTASLQRVTTTMTEQLTDHKHAGRMLADLYRHNYCTYRHGDDGDAPYQYHPLFQQFHLTQVQQQFAPELLKTVRAQAAAILKLPPISGTQPETGRNSSHTV